jgi:hypothetical protein
MTGEQQAPLVHYRRLLPSLNRRVVGFIIHSRHLSSKVRKHVIAAKAMYDMTVGK